METKQNSFFNKKSKGFTIAEILMVISIIAFLGAIILVAARGALEKARIARGLNFSAQINHALGAYVTGIWNFDDETPKDSSGNENHGTPVDDPEAKEGIVGKSFEFDGTGDHFWISDPGDNSKLDATDAITIEAWIMIFNDVDGRPIVAKKDSYYLMYKISKKLCFRIETQPTFYEVCTDGLSLNKWYHCAGTYNGSKLRLFLDGREVADPVDASGDIKDTNTNLLIGALFVPWAQYWFIGRIDEVRVYHEGLNSAQIKQHYVEGAKKRELLTEK